MRYGQEKITKLEKTSATLATLPAGSIITVGGQKFVTSSPLTIDLSVDGLGGVIGGAVLNTFLYIYAVSNSGVLGLIASTSESNPSGYDAYRKIGAMSLDGSVEILDIRNGEGFKKYQKKFMASNVSNSQTIPSLTFENITLGKKYELNGQVSISVTSSNHRARLDMYNNATSGINRIGRLYSNVDSSNTMRPVESFASAMFEAIETSVVTASSAVVTCIINGNGTIDETFFELVEYPDGNFDAVIETNEW